MDLELFNAVRSYLLKKLKKSQLTPEELAQLLKELIDLLGGQNMLKELLTRIFTWYSNLDKLLIIYILSALLSGLALLGSLGLIG